MKREIVPLTSLRGIAASAVVLFHFYQGQPSHSALLDHTVGRGYLWVDFFFVLSGFVMAESHGADFRDGFRLSPYRDFLIRRLARIYPLYIVLTVALLPFLSSQCFDLQAYPAMPSATARFAMWSGANVLMVQAWGLAPSIVGPGWSLSTEWASYLLFPILVFAVLTSRRTIAGSVGALALMGLVVVARHGPNGQLNVFADGPFPVMRCVAGFSLGLLTWRLAAWPPLRRLTQGDAPLAAALILLASLFAACDLDVMVALAFPIVVICAANNDGRIGRALEAKPLVTLGVLSYAIYLVHFPLLNLIVPALRPTTTALPPDLAAGATLAAVFTASLLSAAILHRLVEKPAHRAIRFYASRLARRPGEERAASAAD